MGFETVGVQMLAVGLLCFLEVPVQGVFTQASFADKGKSSMRETKEERSGGFKV